MNDGRLQAGFLAQRLMLLRRAAARLGSADDAAAMLPDLWLRIDQLADQPIAQPAAFLYRIVANLATDRRIAAGRRGARETAWSDVQPLAGELPDPERWRAVRCDLLCVEQVIAAMPERMATALRMFRLDGQSQRAVAEHLGISVSGVEKLLQRAYRRIHDRLEEIAADARTPYRLESERGPKRAE